MKALVLTKPNHFELTDCPDPALGPHDVLIEVRACGICGSDVHGMDGSTRRRQPPIIMGHEAAGVIAHIGRAVSQYKKGDRVTFDSTVYCNQCHFCRQGKINLCDNRQVLGVSCDDYRRDGAFAQFVAVPEHILYRLPDAVSFEQAAMTEALSIALHAVNRSPLAPGQTAVVVGAGMIGLLVVQALRAAHCHKIIAIDLDPDRLQLAGQLGAHLTLNPKTDDVLAQCNKLTDNRGADLAFEVVGITSTIQTALSVLRKAGHLTLVGNVSPTVELPLQAVVTRELTLAGSCASAGEYPDCLDHIANRSINVDALISAVAPLHEGPAWFQRLYNKEPGLMKVILSPNL